MSFDNEETLAEVLERILLVAEEPGSFVSAVWYGSYALERIADTLNETPQTVHVTPVLFTNAPAGANALEKAVGLRPSQLESLVAEHGLKHGNFDGYIFVLAADVLQALGTQSKTAEKAKQPKKARKKVK